MLRIAKYHGLGNDFLVALAADNPGLAPSPALARALCDRRRGIGADGLVVGLPGARPGPDGPASGGPASGGPASDGPVSDARMVLLNADGSEAEISGNGIRCLGQALLRAAGRSEGGLCIDTPAGRRNLRVVRGEVGGEVWIDVDMGPAGPGPEVSAAARAYPAAAVGTVDMGNPHLVLVVDEPDGVDLAVDGPALEAGYPGGINVHFVRARGADRLELRVWERGAGITEACGSGACAAVVAATELGLVKGRVTVEMPGGPAEVEVVDGSVHLTGPSTFVADITVPDITVPDVTVPDVTVATETVAGG